MDYSPNNHQQGRQPSAKKLKENNTNLMMPTESKNSTIFSHPATVINCNSIGPLRSYQNLFTGCAEGWPAGDLEMFNFQVAHGVIQKLSR